MSKPGQPAVSVVISFFNSERHLESTLAQLRQLDLTNYELILIDDASTDATLSRLRETEFARFVVANETNLGIAGTRNKAIALATAEYVWLGDHDDLWEPQIIDELLRLAREFDADLAACGGDFIDGATGKFLGPIESPPRREVLTREQAVRVLLGGKIQGYTWNKIVRRSILPKDAYDSTYEPKEDLARLILTLEQCERVAVLPEILYHHLDFPTAMTRVMHPNLSPYERCYEQARDMALRIGATPANSPLLRRYAYYQFIGPSIGTALSRDALSGAHARSNLELLKRARKLTHWRDLPGVMLRFPVQGLLAAAFKVLGPRLVPLYRALRPR